MNALRSYNCYFTFPELAPEQYEELKEIFADRELEVDLSLESLEFEYTGNGAGNLVPGIFQLVAGVLENADGELKAAVDTGERDPAFEFFTIRDGCLYLQRATILREDAIVRLDL